MEHLKLKSKQIAAAYGAFAHAQERWRVDEATGSGGVFLLYPKGDERQHPQFLLGQVELAEHIRETNAAEAALAHTSAQLQALGIV